ncbi:DUF808 domain-containing protein [Congregibacter brevis]|uniref:DUF808 domain-containing protein n=1 Tax=Congregibacter brevis TaxID=3081201 RepID=A0ABZ0IA86_9GAMM|nr:DUF808 domain-containing protein [Congregibacter sp. IMCC45268]
MAGASLLALLDDIATLMDDVTVMSKIAARKTAGVLGDDLAVNAEKVTGVAAERELPVVYAVFKGSMLNKAMLVPAAIVIAAVAEWLITPLLIAGGLFLCFEGFEKLWHYLSHSADTRREAGESLRKQLENPNTNPLQLEKKRIKGAVRTDFILSAEIIVITLGIVGDASLLVRASVLTAIALLMTIGVYGLVAVIVKIDDLGLHWVQTEHQGFGGGVLRGAGKGLLLLAPRLMRALTVLGTAAMFLVGGGILVHGIPFLHHLSEDVLQMSMQLLADNAWVRAITPQLFAAILGLLAGSVVLIIISAGSRVFGTRS